MIRGVVEDVNKLHDGRVALNGWACYQDSDGVFPVSNVVLEGRSDVIATPTDRKIDGTPGCGFRLLLGSVDDLAAYYWNALPLRAHARGESKDLRIWKQIEPKIIEIIVTALAARSGLSIAATVGRQDTQVADRDREIVSRFRSEALKNPSADNVMVECGAISHDSQVTIGKGGFLFLLGGSNGLLHQYSWKANPETIGGWVSLIQKRSEQCALMGIKFIQLIVPEKQSVIPELFPAPIDVPTRLLNGINKALDAQEFYMDCTASLRKLFVSGGLQPFRKVDSHLSYFGVEAVVRECMRALGLTGEIFAKKLREEQRGGDLGGKFFEGRMLESILMPTEDWEFAQDVPELVRSEAPKSGHIGIEMEWRAKRPLSSQSVLIFGNSMFERGASALTLSWWFSRLFARSRFIWSPGMKKEAIDEFRPDVVICQTVERFLPTLPTS